MLSNKKLPLAVVILTYNEEKNIEKCLESVAHWADEIFIVDSFSTDRTLELAAKYTNKIYRHPFEGHARQWNWAFKNMPFSFQWCFALDADQRLSRALASELKTLLENGSRRDNIVGYYVKRKQLFRGRPIRYGGYQNRRLLKIFKVKYVSSDENELIDFRFYVKGKTAGLKGYIIEDNLNDYDISFWLAKHNRFSTLQAQEELLRRRNRLKWQIRPSLLGAPDARVLLFKDIYYRLPPYIRSFFYFFYRYFILLGFLDGPEGLIYHLLHGLCYRLIVDMKISELNRLNKSNG